MFKHNPKQSRRQVQRRFPPGTIVVSETNRMTMVVGWAPTAPTFNKRTGAVISPQNWAVYIIGGDNRLQTVDWEWLERHYTSLEEWEGLPGEA